jgi:hypothetical protein
MGHARSLKRIAAWSAISLIVLCACAWFWSTRSPSFDDPLGDEPGQTWVKGRGYSHAVRLMDSGRYTMQVQCDICAEPIQSGTWTRQGHAVVLRHASGSIAMELVPVSMMGCDALARRGEQNARVPGGVYFKQDDRCADAL